MRISSAALIKGALGASLALNIVLGGLLLLRPERPVRPDVGRLAAHLESLLPEADRPAFHKALEVAQPTYMAALQAQRDNRALVDAAMRQDPFDAAALRAAMANGRGYWQEFSQSFEDSLVAGMAMISPEGRRKLADDMPGRGRRNRGGQASGKQE
jgi:uncharacterized membrane protein